MEDSAALNVPPPDKAPAMKSEPPPPPPPPPYSGPAPPPAPPPTRMGVGPIDTEVSLPPSPPPKARARLIDTFVTPGGAVQEPEVVKVTVQAEPPVAGSHDRTGATVTAPARETSPTAYKPAAQAKTAVALALHGRRWRCFIVFLAPSSNILLPESRPSLPIRFKSPRSPVSAVTWCLWRA